MKSKPLKIDMIAGSQIRDTQGEMLSVEGADISELESGSGRLNDNHGKGFFNCIGRVTGAKKIFKAEDCEDDRQKYYWEKVKSPFIYVKGELFNDSDHPNARAAAAVLKNIHKNDCPLKLKASVEGGTIARGISDPSLLARTKIHSVALTFTPANQATLVEPTTLQKTGTSPEEEALIKSVVHLARTDVPSFIDISERMAEEKTRLNIEKIAKMVKALCAGYGGAAAPTSRTGGAVIQSESLDDGRKKIKKDEVRQKDGFIYITCKSCGKEQVHMKHQVKCRNCGQSFNFVDLADLDDDALGGGADGA